MNKRRQYLKGRNINIKRHYLRYYLRHGKVFSHITVMRDAKHDGIYISVNRRDVAFVAKDKVLLPYSPFQDIMERFADKQKRPVRYVPNLPKRATPVRTANRTNWWVFPTFEKPKPVIQQNEQDQTYTRTYADLVEASTGIRPARFDYNSYVQAVERINANSYRVVRNDLTSMTTSGDLNDMYVSNDVPF